MSRLRILDQLGVIRPKKLLLLNPFQLLLNHFKRPRLRRILLPHQLRLLLNQCKRFLLLNPFQLSLHQFTKLLLLHQFKKLVSLNQCKRTRLRRLLLLHQLGMPRLRLQILHQLGMTSLLGILTQIGEYTMIGEEESRTEKPCLRFLLHCFRLAHQKNMVSFPF